jgi:hypothetical protein
MTVSPAFGTGDPTADDASPIRLNGCPGCGDRSPAGRLPATGWPTIGWPTIG